MYAITFDLSITQVEKHYRKKSYQKAHAEVTEFLAQHGFERYQNGLYVAAGDVSVAQVVMSVNELGQKHEWFGKAAQNVRLLEINQNVDLSVAL